ncbi:MAG: glycosyltransferase family 2 protein [Leptospirillia bacterium]
MQKLSAFITTYNNERTLPACLESVKWADEIVVLDSFSTDRTVEIARNYGAKVSQHAFMGYGPQKQMALEATSHDWGLLLDADEALSPACQKEVQDLMAGVPSMDGYEIPRQEQLFWQMNNPAVRMNGFLRLFNKHKGYISDMPVHAAPKVTGRIGRLKHPFYHYGEVDIHTKVDKVNSYSSGLVDERAEKPGKGNPFMMVVYPPIYFFKTYFFKRNFLNGWAGFIGSVVLAFYVFLKYAKVYERRQFQKHGQSKMPEGAPPPAGGPLSHKV